MYPTAIRIAGIWALVDLQQALGSLRDAFREKGFEFADIVKMGRTQLQDAVPMTLGQEFTAAAVTIGEDIDRLRETTLLLREINMGATAIGTGINTDPRYAALVREKLSAVTGYPFASAAAFSASPANTFQFRCVIVAPRRFSMLSLELVMPLG